MVEWILIFQIFTLLMGIFYARRPEFEKFPYYISAISIFSAILAIGTFVNQIISPQITKKILFNLLEFNNYSLNFCLLSDSLSITVIAIVCLITAISNFYSLGYIQKNLPLFLCYLNAMPIFLTFFIASDNLMQMYICLHLLYVGSYFLISFDRKETSIKKGNNFLAVIKIGDAIFLIAVALILKNFETLSFEDINKFSIQDDAQLRSLEIISVIMIISIVLKSFPTGILSCGRHSSSAPIPALVVIQSSVISAAEIFIIIRLQSIFECSETIQDMLVLAGLFEAILGAISAGYQKDIRKILVYSSISQSGLMLTACGFSAYGAAIMLYITHAFSKSLLTFASGSIIKALSGECCIDKMGGLMETLPKTYASFVIAIISACCFPLLPSYYANKILVNDIIFSESDLYYFALLSITAVALLTSLYFFRVLYKIFHGPTHIDEISFGYANENDKFITISLYISIFLAIFSGVIFYYAAYTSTIWKDLAVFSYKSNSVVVIAFFTVNFIGIIGAIMVSKSLKFSQVNFPTYKLLIIFWHLCLLKIKIYGNQLVSNFRRKDSQ